MCGFKGTNEGQDQLVSCREGKEEEKDEVEHCGIKVCQDSNHRDHTLIGPTYDWRTRHTQVPNTMGTCVWEPCVDRQRRKELRDHVNDWDWISFHDVWKSH